MSSSQSGFLSLAPATSASYPQAPKRAAAASGTPLTTGALSALPAQLTVKERTSSMSSDGSSTKPASVVRFLKLGPVHYGEHADGGRVDWSDVVIE